MDLDRLSKAIDALIRLVERLRGLDGCPWDAKQTDSSIRIYLLEEAYEVLEAIENASPQDVCMELGDLLFHILFLAQLAAERNEFDFIDVLEKITEKMIRRHPHVFGSANVNSAEEVVINWAKIKKAENDNADYTSFFLKNVPVNMPSLLRSHRLIERASVAGVLMDDPDKVSDEVKKQFEELGIALATQDKDLVGKKMGPLLSSLINLTRLYGLNAEDLLRHTNHMFLKRFEEMEMGMKAEGIELEDATPGQINSAWENAKPEI